MLTLARIDGGIGKDIAATGAIATLMVEAGGEIVILSSYPEVFLHNRSVLRTYHSDICPYFAQDWMFKADRVIARDPYLESGFILGKQNLAQAFLTAWDLSGPLRSSEIFLTRIERDMVPNHDYAVIQVIGGPIKDKPRPWSWVRDLALTDAHAVVKYLNDQQIKVYSLHHPTQKNPLESVAPSCAFNSLRETLAFISKARLCISGDSMLHHAAVALGRTCVACFGTELERFRFGYAGVSQTSYATISLEQHLTREFRHRDGVLSEISIYGEPWQYPYIETAEYGSHLVDAIRRLNY